MPGELKIPRRRERSGVRVGQAGIGLIEILVAVVLLSVGLLASERMQIQSMRASRGAHYQSQAYLLANDMVDRMRTNGAGLLAGRYDAIQTSAAVSDPGCATASCNAEGRARQDLYEWSARLHPLGGTTGFVPALPGTGESAPVGSVTSLGDDAYVVTLTWSESVDGVATSRTYSTQFTALGEQ